MKDTIKGFICGALLMLITPAFAVQGTPQSVSEELTATTADAEALPYFRLTYEDAEDAIAQALAERGAGAKISVSITNRQGDSIFSYSQPTSVEIRGLQYDAKLNRFTSNLVSLAEGGVISVRPVSGRYQEMVEVPVLSRSLRAGDVIAKDDIEIRDYPKSRVRSDTVMDMDSLIGKSPERVITYGRPVRSHELAAASVVKKDDLIKMVFERGTMSITTSGQALEGGGVGSVIRVRNTQSKKIVQAVVRDAETVVLGEARLETSRLEAGGAYEN